MWRQEASMTRCKSGIPTLAKPSTPIMVTQVPSTPWPGLPMASASPLAVEAPLAAEIQPSRSGTPPMAAMYSPIADTPPKASMPSPGPPIAATSSLAVTIKQYRSGNQNRDLPESTGQASPRFTPVKRGDVYSRDDPCGHPNPCCMDDLPHPTID